MVNVHSRAVFLDRDGVLNRSVVGDSGLGRAPWSVDEVKVFGEQSPAVERLASAGWLLVVVTNQPDVARGIMNEMQAQEINDVVVQAFPGLTSSYVCMHTGSDGCSCRKPLPGMLLQAAQDLDIDTSRSWMVGDRWVDVAAGAAAGCRTILIEGPESWLPTSHGSAPADLVPDFVAVDLTQAVDVILERC